MVDNLKYVEYDSKLVRITGPCSYNDDKVMAETVYDANGNKPYHGRPQPYSRDSLHDITRRDIDKMIKRNKKRIIKAQEGVTNLENLLTSLK